MSRKQPTKRGRGRPTKLTPTLRDRIVRLVRDLGFINLAAAEAGIRTSTIHDWLRRGELEPGSIYAEFSESVREAEGRCEASLVGPLVRAARKRPELALKVAKAKWPERYGERTKLALQEERQATIDTLRAGLDEVTFERVLRVLASRQDGGARAGTD